MGSALSYLNLPYLNSTIKGEIMNTIKTEIEIVAEKKFNKQLSIIKRIGKTGDELIHSAGLYAMEQVNLHGNKTPANQLLSVLGKNVRKEALITWFIDYGKVQRNNENNTLEYVKGKELKFSFETNRPSPTGTIVTPEEALLFAEEMPFYDYTKEKKVSSIYDVNAAILQLFRNAKAAPLKGKRVEHGEKIEQLKTLFPELAELAA